MGRVVVALLLLAGCASAQEPGPVRLESPKWPRSYEDAGDKVVVYEPQVGGRVYDRLRDGRENQWATVLAWEPPRRVAIEWNVTPANPPTELEVRFTSEGDGTRVDLEHSGWERYGDNAAESFGSYNEGWDFVLGRYVDRANA